MPSTYDITNSRPLDVHRWSDHPEVSSFFSKVQAKYFRNVRSKRQKQALKVLLLDLYVVWQDDPSQFITLPMSQKAYCRGSRFRSIFVDYKIIALVKQATEKGLILQISGSEWSQKVTRIRATERLARIFRRGDLNLPIQQSNLNRPCLIVRDMDKSNIIGWANQACGLELAFAHKATEQLTAYNNILQNTLIDIPTAKRNKVPLGNTNKTTGWIHISDYNKFVHRVFNNASLTKGGRFCLLVAKCAKEIRSHIFINHFI